MLRSAARPRQPAKVPADNLAHQLEHLHSLTTEDLGKQWSQVFRVSLPGGLTRDLLIRMLAHRLQEQMFRRLPAADAKVLAQAAKSSGEPQRRLKTGTILVREHDGVLHEAVVVPGGFVWKERTYPSLSAIAREITGTSWNGPRFFGLRIKRTPLQSKATNGISETAL